MSNPDVHRLDVPLRMELTFELPGTPQQVWDAIATANGITAWFTRTDLEERDGGAIRLYMGEGSQSDGTVTGWEPPSRFAYVEPDWAELVGHEKGSVGPMVTEFLIDARSGGTCSLRVVSSSFGSGADWEQEFFDDMERSWVPFFDNLRLYLTHFPGQQVTPLEAATDAAGTADEAWSALCGALGASRVGERVEVRGVTADVERVGSPPGPKELLLRISDPVPGFMQFGVWQDRVTKIVLQGYLFSADAPAYVEREGAPWQAWLERLTVPRALKGLEG